MDEKKLEIFHAGITTYIQRMCDSLGTSESDWKIEATNAPFFPTSESEMIKVYSPMVLIYCVSKNHDFCREIVRRSRSTMLNWKNINKTVSIELSKTEMEEIGEMVGPFIQCYYAKKQIGQFYMDEVLPLNF
jgi:hypothetical protein